MFSKIKDLERFQLDQKRFKIALDSTDGDVRTEGKKLLENLLNAVESFDNVMDVFVADPSGSRMDHATAQRMVAESKWALENWILKYAPNIHVETTKY